MCLFHGTTSVGWNLLDSVAQNQTAAVSPLSIVLAVFMLYPGVDKDSQDEIRNSFMSNVDDTYFTNFYSNFLTDVKTTNKNKVDTRIVNRIFIKNDFEINKTYLDNIEKNAAAKAENLDFGNADKSSSIVNEFISNSTNGKIKDLVKPETFINNVAVLVNALYFKAEWKNKLAEYQVRNGEFHVTANTKKTVSFMEESDKHQLYYEDENVQLLKLPYVDEDFSFSFILPKKRFGLSGLRKFVNGDSTQEFIEKAKPTLVNMKVPKFKVSTEINLKNALPELGFKRIFSDTADFSKISPGLKVSEASTKTVVEIDENGTEAAAATFIGIEDESGILGKRKPFIADHPFYYAIYYKKYPLFLGSYLG